MDKLKNKIQDNLRELDVDQPSPLTWEMMKKSLSDNAASDVVKAQINRNREEFDIDTPHAETWALISESIGAKKVRPLRTRLLYMSAAACIVTIIGLAIAWYTHTNEIKTGNTETGTMVVKDPVLPGSSETRDSAHLNEPLGTNEIAEQKATPVNTSTASAIPMAAKAPHKKIKLPPQVLQMEKDYDEIIESQLKYTRSLAIYGESSNYFAQFKNDFKMLEQQEKALRKDIAKKGLQENSIDELAMIYQQKLTVLKKLQNEINKTSSRNKNITDTIPVYINL